MKLWYHFFMTGRIPYARARALMTMVGSIIGAGIFGIPYVYLRSGVLYSVILTLFVAGCLMLLYLLFAETLLREKDPHRLPGLVTRHLGAGWGKMVTLTDVFGYWLSLLAYFLLGGSFLSMLFGPWIHIPPDIWNIIFYLLCAAVVGPGLYLVTEVELILTSTLLVLLVGFLLWIAPAGHADVLTFLPASVSWYSPWGVILFSLVGLSAIPTMRSVLRGNEQYLKQTIVAGTIISALLTIAFGVIIVSITGSATTETAFEGLAMIVGPWVMRVGALFGLLAIATSFFSTGLYVRDVFRLDEGMSRLNASLIALATPLALYLIGARHFLSVIGFAGSFLAACVTFFVCAVYRVQTRKKGRTPEFYLHASDGVLVFLIMIFLGGFLCNTFASH